MIVKKKILCVFIILTMISCMFSCNNPTLTYEETQRLGDAGNIDSKSNSEASESGTHNSEAVLSEFEKRALTVLSEVYAVDEFGYSSEEEYTEKNLISMKTIKYVDNDVATVIEKEIAGVSYNLSYVETRLYPGFERISNRYKFEKDGKTEYVDVDKNGEILSVLFTFGHIDIAGEKSLERIIELAKPVISQVVDVSKYEYCEIPTYGENSSVSSYLYTYYNMDNGYITDFMNVWIKPDGSIDGISKTDFNTECDLSNIDKELEDAVLNMKMKQVYDGRYGPYVKYKTVHDQEPVVYVFNGEITVMYSIAAVVLDYYGQEQSAGYIQRILIPLRILDDSNK